MASNYELIGLRLSQPDEFDTLLKDSRIHRTEIDFGGVSYLVVEDDHGAQLWVAIETGTAVSANPFFSLAPPCLVTIDAVPSPDPSSERFDADLTITLYENGETATRMQAFSVNIPGKVKVRPSFWKLRRGAEFASVADVSGSLKTPVKAHICVFSHKTRVFSDEDAHAAHQSTNALQMAPESFVSWGLFSDDKANTTGAGSGRVLAAGRVDDGLSRIPYCWASLRCVGGVYSVVWSPNDAPTAAVGNIVSFDGYMAVSAVSPFWVR